MSRAALAWLASRVEPARAEWLLGMQAELEAIHGGWPKLVWAFGALPLAWSFNRHRLAPAIARHLTGGSMNDSRQPAVRPWLDTLVLNAVTLVGWWLCLTFVVFQIGGLREWRSGELILLVAVAVGAPAALALHMRGAAYVLSGFVAYQSVETVFHRAYGFQLVAEGHVHFANMAAGILAVTWTAYIVRDSGDPIAPTWNPKDVLASAVRIGVAVRRRIGLATALPVGCAVFVIVEFGMRLAFGLHPLRDSMSNGAIFLSSVVGALLGFAAGGPGERLTHRPNKQIDVAALQ
jgi:hypothetical protein